VLESSPARATLEIPPTLAARWLATLCQQIPGVEQGVVLFGTDLESAQRTSTSWPEGTQCTGEFMAAAEHALSQAAAVVHSQDGAGSATRARIACPIIVHEQPHGVIVVSVSALATHQRDVVIQILQWGSTWLELALEQRAAPAATRLPALLEGLESAFELQGFAPVALAVVSHLAYHLGFERVSIGLQRRGHVELIALSDSPSVSRRTSYAQVLESAMSEVMHSNTVVAYPRDSSQDPGHRALAQQSDSLAICSVPLRHAGHPFAVLTFESVTDRTLDAERVQLCAAVAAALGPVLALKQMHDKPWWSRSGNALIGPRAGRLDTLRKVGVALLVFVGCVILAVATAEYRIAAPATVEGRVQRAVIAPFDGFVESAGVRAGDHVLRDVILAQLDDEPLLLEQRKWLSQREELVKQYRRALVARERADSSILEARVAQVDTELELLKAQLERTALRAPFDGIVVSGDLSTRLGAPVTRGQVLFEIAPLNDYRVVLQIDESDMSELVVGLPGTLALTGLPDARLPLAVRKIGSSARDSDGRNVVQVEAQLENLSAERLGTLRPGMHGVAKIALGERRLLWIWTHSLVDWARLALWSGLP
jgi:multidrug resistance efflux pump